MKTTSPSQSRSQELLAQIGRIPAIVRGKLSERRSRGKLTGYKLQRWQNGRNETLHVPAEKVEGVQEGTDGYRLFTKLSEEYVQAREQEVLRADTASKKKSSRR
jgi:hypothetical protein